MLNYIWQEFLKNLPFISELRISRNLIHYDLMFSHQVMSDSSLSYGLQHARPPCPSPSPGVCPRSCPLNQWCYPSISSSSDTGTECRLFILFSVVKVLLVIFFSFNHSFIKQVFEGDLYIQLLWTYIKTRCHCIQIALV